MGSSVQGAGYDLGIICTKQHEFDAFRSALDSNRINHGVVTPVDDWCYFDWTQNGRRIIAASFLDVQGPVECAMRATQLIQMFGLKTIAMVGIAGGKDRLGDVVVAYSAFTPECGRTVRVPADGAPPDSGWKYVPSRDVNRNEGYIESRDYLGLVTQFTSNPPLLNDAGQPYNVLPGPFASYNEVRNDCSVLLISHPTLMEFKCTAIEMEAYALIKAASLSKVKVLAVVKGISDVGEERFEGWLAQDQRTGVAVHNWNQLHLVEPALSVLPQDNNDLRKKYRKIAGRRAAQVMLELVRMWAM